jgi:hypothetical protein
MASHPKIRILTIDVGWSELDTKSKKVLTQWAIDNNCQIWITKVTDEPDSAGFHIFDGEVVAIDGAPVSVEPDAAEGNGNASPVFDPVPTDEAKEGVAA